MTLSKVARVLAVTAAVCGAVLLCAAGAVAQIERVTVEVVPESATAKIQLFSTSRKSWSFPDTYANLVGLGKRVGNFQALDIPGARNSVREMAPGHFELGAPASSVSYEVDLSSPTRATDTAFVSWLTRERGILRLSDLLPIRFPDPGNASRDIFVEITTPQGWGAYSDEEVTATLAYRFDDPDSAVIVVGKNVRRAVQTVSGKLFKLLIEGQWAFSDQEGMDVLLKTVQFHSEVGELPCNQVTLVLSTFPGGSATSNTWSAETRGCNVTLLLGKVPSKTAALGQLGNALTHELFHLWIPNGVKLMGDYDWFYEGFTMYEAARAAVRLGLVTWPEFLNAIARAHDGSMSTVAPPLSLIDASKQRWTVGASSVYSKAMVVAFLYDLNLRNQTGGKRSLDDVYRRILRAHGRAFGAQSADADGNAAAMAALRAELSLPGFVERFITVPVSIELTKELAPFGLRVEKLLRTHISVADSATKRQRDLLKQLGYNEPRGRRQSPD